MYMYNTLHSIPLHHITSHHITSHHITLQPPEGRLAAGPYLRPSAGDKLRRGGGSAAGPLFSFSCFECMCSFSFFFLLFSFGVGMSFGEVEAVLQARICIREEQCRAMKGGQTAQKANRYLGDFWTYQPEHVLTFSLMKYH